MWAPDIQASAEPIYLAIAKAIARDIGDGVLPPGSRLPTQRDLAHELDVAIGTVTRGYVEAERRGLIRGLTGRGTFVRDPDEGLVQGLTPFSANNGGEFVDLSFNFPIGAEDPDLAGALSELAQDPHVDRLMQYRSVQEDPRCLRAAASWLSAMGVDAQPDRLVVAAGAQHALMVILGAMANPNDLVLTDELTYTGIKSAAALFKLRIHPIPMDEQGMRPDALRRACRQRKANFLYVMPTIQNPTSAVMDEQRRADITKVAAEFDLLIIEDDGHRALADDPATPILHLAPERTFFVGGASKVLAGGLRVGYLAAPTLAMNRLKQSLWSTMCIVPPLMVEIATRWIEDGTAEQVRRAKRREAEARQEMAASILDGVAMRRHPRSYFVWIDLPPELHSADFAIALRDRGVGVTPAQAFTADERATHNGVRVCLGAAQSHERLSRALHTIRAALLEECCCSTRVV